MPSIKRLEMADAVSTHNHITIKKSLFSTKVLYEPTQSRVKVMVLDYSPTEGERLERMLSLSPEMISKEIERKGRPISGPVGNFQLEVCLSHDHQFCALQLLRFIDYSYQPVGEVHIFEGSEAELVSNLF